MLRKINRQDAIARYRVFPQRSYDEGKDEEIVLYPKVCKSYILTLTAKTFKGLVTILGAELTSLTKALGCDGLIFLGDTDDSWLCQVNDYKPVREAYQYLMEQGVGKRFNGALQVDITELPKFVRHLSWLTRCNATLPYFYFMDKSQTVIGSICKYGNLHFDTLSESGDIAFAKAVENTRFEYLDGNNCSQGFGKTTKITGRQITL